MSLDRLAKLREHEMAGKRAMLMFQDALARHTEALHLGIDYDVLNARQDAHDSLDAYMDHLRALHGG